MDLAELPSGLNLPAPGAARPARLAGCLLPAYKSRFQFSGESMAQQPADEVSEATSHPAVELVVAVAENDVIGRANRLPWHIAADLRRFKSLTLGKPILMGRKTYQSIGKALPGRINLVLTRSAEFAPGDCTVVDNLDAARRAAGALPHLMVIGGAEIYRQCLCFATRIHLTLVHAVIEDGDTFFSAWRDPTWRETFRERHEADDRNTFAYSFITLQREVGRSAEVCG